MEEDIEADLFACADRVVLDFEVLGLDPDERDPDVCASQVRRATLLAGLLWAASEAMIDNLCDDLIGLVENPIETYQASIDEFWRPMLGDHLFEDLDHEMRYDADLDGFENDPTFAGPPGMAPMTFDAWFVPFTSDRRLPPYAKDLPAGGHRT